MSAELTRHQRSTERPHGTRARYMAGCSCLPCRAANASYISERKLAAAKGRGNHLVSSYHAREHLLALQKRGLGMRRAAQLADVSFGTICKVMYVTSPIRRQVSDQIRAVVFSPAAGARVPADRTWHRIGLLVEEGYSQRRLAGLLGSTHGASIQLGRERVTRRTELRVAQLYRTLTT